MNKRDFRNSVTLLARAVKFRDGYGLAYSGNNAGTIAVSGRPDLMWVRDRGGNPYRIKKGTISPAIPAGVPLWVGRVDGYSPNVQEAKGVAIEQLDPASYTGQTYNSAFAGGPMQIVYGDASGEGTSSPDLKWDEAQHGLFLISNAGGPRIVMSDYSDTAGDNPFIYGRRAGGTEASPTAIQSGMIINRFSGEGYGTSFTNTSTGAIDILASENGTATAKGTYQRGYVTKNGTTSKFIAWIYNHLGVFQPQRNVAPLIASVSADTTLDETHGTVLVDASGGNKTITLPALATAYVAPNGYLYNVKKIDATANTVTLDGNASETIDGATTLVLTAQYQTRTIQAGPTEWSIL